MARYRAKADLFVGGAPVKSGAEFESNDVPGKNWEPLDELGKSKFAARFGNPEAASAGPAPLDAPVVETAPEHQVRTVPRAATHRPGQQPQQGRQPQQAEKPESDR